MGIKKYTAMIPKTLKASRRAGKMGMNKASNFLRRGKKTIRRLPRLINNTVSRSIRSLTKKQSRK